MINCITVPHNSINSIMLDQNIISGFDIVLPTGFHILIIHFNARKLILSNY